ncbi:MAG: hypothetical protein ACJAT1_001061 [Marivirga sp.]
MLSKQGSFLAVCAFGANYLIVFCLAAILFFSLEKLTENPILLCQCKKVGESGMKCHELY